MKLFRVLLNNAYRLHVTFCYLTNTNERVLHVDTTLQNEKMNIQIYHEKNFVYRLNMLRKGLNVFVLTYTKFFEGDYIEKVAVCLTRRLQDKKIKIEDWLVENYRKMDGFLDKIFLSEQLKVFIE